MNDGMDSGIESENGTGIIAVEDEVTTREEDLAGGRQGGGTGNAVGHESEAGGDVVMKSVEVGVVEMIDTYFWN